MQPLSKLDHLLEGFLNQRKLKRTFRLMASCGIDIDSVYDIGANKGRWTKTMKRMLPKARFFMFEANEAHREKLASRGHPFFIGVLAANEESRVFFTNDGTGDSLYRENTRHYNDNHVRDVQTKTLSSVVLTHNLPKPAFVKLDVQGAEIDILKGSGSVLDNCHLVFMECPLLEYNINAPTIQTYISHMQGIGFLPLHILEQHIINGALTQFDILFIRKSTQDIVFGSGSNN
jgi:FkbM family methyltransferase